MQASVSGLTYISTYISGNLSGTLFDVAQLNVGARYNEYKYFEPGRFFLARRCLMASAQRAASSSVNGSSVFKSPIRV